MNSDLLKEILQDYINGMSPSSICRKFGLSERNYGSILKQYSAAFGEAKEARSMNQKMRRDLLKKNHSGAPVEEVKKKKITANEKIAHLEKLLQIEQKKNQELESLLKVAKDHLGKF